jgi:hypothetical protein
MNYIMINCSLNKLNRKKQQCFNYVRNVINKTIALFVEVIKKSMMMNIF